MNLLPEGASIVVLRGRLRKLYLRACVVVRSRLLSPSHTSHKISLSLSLSLSSSYSSNKKHDDEEEEEGAGDGFGVEQPQNKANNKA